ncbi:hypothetical protein GCM10025876_36280 [Demequina litorisediminis]|uniref:Pup--protein ligase n=1 Tax=Demequina litorisediminis TaxID=1849022 RepID=A0ABQ6IL67_9MICO|nr:hypothetical protein GCM10025876_36280 [Demequina litorisediminis]
MAGHLFHSVVRWGRSSNVFLTNASRLYIDVGAHPEYATAECDTLTDLIASDKAGERIVQALVAEGESRLAEAGVAGEIHLYKNNTDSAGNSYGCHENYLVRRRADFRAFASALLPYLVTRQIVTGAGTITRTPEGAHYSFSPRADHMWEGLSSATTRSRPMINTRDEPHANAEPVSPHARDRRRLDHGRADHPAQGGRHRPDAAPHGGARAPAGPHARQRDAGHPDRGA